MTATADTKFEKIKAIKNAFHALMWIGARQLSQRLQPYGLTQPQFITLLALNAHKQSCTMSDLTNVTFQDPPTMTGIVDRLLKMKLVQRTRSEQDRRVVLVQTTETGEALIKKINEEIATDELAFYYQLTNEELLAFEQLLRFKLRMYIGKYRAINNANLESEIQQLQQFVNDPISYMKAENTPESLT